MIRYTVSKETVLQAVVEHLAADLAEAEHDLVAYREMAQLALAQNAMLTRDVDKAREQIAALRDENRRIIRGHFEGGNGAAA